MDRRTFLKTTSVLGAGIGLAGCGGSRLLADVPAQGAPNAEKIGWRLGCQAWTFNRFSFFEAIDKTASLGLHYIETGSFQTVRKDRPNVKFTEDSPADVRADVKKKLADSGVKLPSFGVISLFKDVGKSRKILRFRQGHGHRDARGGAGRGGRLRDARQTVRGIRHEDRRSQSSEALALLEPRHGAQGVPRPQQPDWRLRRHRPLGAIGPQSGRVPQKVGRPDHRVPLQGT